MLRRASPALAPLEALHETKRGTVLPLPPGLARLYGRLRIPTARTRPHVFSNFATTLDGVVSLNVNGHKSGGAISGVLAEGRLGLGQLRPHAGALLGRARTLPARR